MKRAILIRHGQAEHQLEDRFGGWSNKTLTDQGIKQAQSVANRLKKELKENYTLFSSDLKRAKQTAKIIQSKIETPVKYSIELREHNPGIASGMTRAEAEQHQHELTEPYIDSQIFPGAETFRQFFVRVSEYMTKIDETENYVIIVSHGGTIHNIIRWWIGTPVTDFFKFGFIVENTGITVLDYNRHGQRVIQRLNDTSHFNSIGLENPIEK